MKPSSNYLQQRAIPGTFVYTHDPNAPTYKARFSKIYRPAALNFFKSFEIVYSHYWRQYSILNYQAVNLYQFLTFLAQADQAFTLAGLAVETKQSKRTISSLLDSLENAELLYRFCLVDCQGRPDYLVLRTPLLECPEALTTRKKELIARAGEDLPETFLSTEHDRLKKQIEKNAVRDRRRKNGRGGEDFKRYWNANLKLFKRDRAAALKFDNLIADLVTQFRGKKITFEAWEKCIAHECKAAGLVCNPQVIAVSHQQRAFYEWFASDAPVKRQKREQYSIAVSTVLPMYRDMLENGYTLEGLAKQFSSSYPPEIWQEIEKGLK
jgi:hypothetical protein